MMQRERQGAAQHPLAFAHFMQTKGQDMRSFQDRVAVVTGAAAGIGQALSEELARRGCHLALVDIDAAGLQTTAARIAALGRCVSTHVVDVANREQMQALAAEVMAQHRRVHLLVNNAGVSLAGRFETYTLTDLEWVIGINLWGTIYGCSFFLPILRQSDEAHIVNISSAFGLMAFPTKTAYCTTKFAVRGFSEALRAELAHSHIGLTCVYPGPVDTGLTRNSRQYDLRKRELETKMVAEHSMPMEYVIRRIMAGIERNDGRVLVGYHTYGIDVMFRLFPVFANTFVAHMHRLLPFI